MWVSDILAGLISAKEFEPQSKKKSDDGFESFCEIYTTLLCVSNSAVVFDSKLA